MHIPSIVLKDNKNIHSSYIHKKKSKISTKITKYYKIKFNQKQNTFYKILN